MIDTAFRDIINRLELSEFSRISFHNVSWKRVISHILKEHKEFVGMYFNSLLWKYIIHTHLICSYSMEDYRGQYLPLSPNHRGR